jgi:hypothetical protein
MLGCRGRILWTSYSSKRWTKWHKHRTETWQWTRSVGLQRSICCIG